MLSTDAKIFAPGSARERITSYGTIVDSLTLVIFSMGSPERINLAQNVIAIRIGGGNKFIVFARGILILLKETKLRAYDVVSSQDPFAIGLAALMVSYLRSIPLQIQVHTDCFSRAYRSESIRRFLEAFIARWVVSRASCVRVVSKRIARSVASMTLAPLSILPILVQPARAVLSVPAPHSGKYITFLVVSRLTKEKQLGIAIEAIARVPLAGLIVVGDGSERNRLEKKVAELALSDRVQFVGWKDDRASSYQHADCFIQTSRYEGYGMALVEAALYALPLISTDVGVVGETFIEGQEVLIADANTESFAAAIRKMVDDEAFRKAMGRRAREKALALVMPPHEYLRKYQEALKTCVF